MPAPSPPQPAAGAPPVDPLAGTPYRVVREIGSGGGGVVYEAVHRELGRRFAIKVLLAGYARDRGALERIRVEAQALAQLRSRHVVEVSDCGHTQDGRPFFVMPLLVGHTLAEELRRRRFLPPGEAVARAREILTGLDAAHRAGLVHRDVKLDNLFLCDEGEGRPVLKILDFGVAKVLPGAEGVEPPGVRTEEGVVVGTPRFIPPEQAMGREVGPAADVYGAGVVLYELLTGRDPFSHVSGFAPLLKAHVSEDAPAPSTVAPQPIDPALDDVVMRALAKRPEDRYASAHELSAALARAMEVTERPPAPAVEAVPVRGPSRAAAVALVVASALVSALVAAALVRGQ